MFDERLIEFINYLRFEKRYSPHTLTAYQNDLDQFRDPKTEVILWPPSLKTGDVVTPYDAGK